MYANTVRLYSWTSPRRECREQELMFHQKQLRTIHHPLWYVTLSPPIAHTVTQSVILFFTPKASPATPIMAYEI